MSALGQFYRFKVHNATGQTIAANSIFAYGRRWKYNPDLSLNNETSQVTFLTNSSTLANGAYLAGTVYDNSSDRWLGMDIIFVVTAPASSAGNVTLFLENSTDGSTQWPDDGLGRIVAVLYFSAAGTKRIGSRIR